MNDGCCFWRRRLISLCRHLFSCTSKIFIHKSFGLHASPLPAAAYPRKETKGIDPNSNVITVNDTSHEGRRRSLSLLPVAEGMHEMSFVSDFLSFLLRVCRKTKSISTTAEYISPCPSFVDRETVPSWSLKQSMALDKYMFTCENAVQKIHLSVVRKHLTASNDAFLILFFCLTPSGYFSTYSQTEWIVDKQICDFRRIYLRRRFEGVASAVLIAKRRTLWHLGKISQRHKEQGSPESFELMQRTIFYI